MIYDSNASIGNGFMIFNHDQVCIINCNILGECQPWIEKPLLSLIGGYQLDSQVTVLYYH